MHSGVVSKPAPILTVLLALRRAQGVATQKGMPRNTKGMAFFGSHMTGCENSQWLKYNSSVWGLVMDGWSEIQENVMKGQDLHWLSWPYEFCHLQKYFKYYDAPIGNRYLNWKSKTNAPNIFSSLFWGWVSHTPYPYVLNWWGFLHWEATLNYIIENMTPIFHFLRRKKSPTKSAWAFFTSLWATSQPTPPTLESWQIGRTMHPQSSRCLYAASHVLTFLGSPWTSRSNLEIACLGPMKID